MTQPTCQHCGKAESEHGGEELYCVINPAVWKIFTPTQPSDGPSPTPRTDAEATKTYIEGWINPGVVSTDFARTLERELTALATELAATKERLQIDPGGSDKIDELESVLNAVRSARNSARAEAAALRDELARLQGDGTGIEIVKMPKRPHVAPENPEPSGDAADHFPWKAGDLVPALELITEIRKDRDKALALAKEATGLLATAQATIAQLTKERDKALIPICIGQPIIQILAKEGQWIDVEGKGVIAADCLFHKDPYKERDALRTQLDTQARQIAAKDEAIHALIDGNYTFVRCHADGNQTDGKCHDPRGDCAGCQAFRLAKAALSLSPDCGNGWVKREDADKLREVLNFCIGVLRGARPVVTEEGSKQDNLDCAIVEAMNRIETALARGREG